MKVLSKKEFLINELKIRTGCSLKDFTLENKKVFNENQVIAILVNGGYVNSDYILTEADEVSVITFDTPEGKDIFWHSSSHILAAAVQQKYPDAQFAIGPSIDNGFYYDVDNVSITEDDLPELVKNFTKIANSNHEFIVSKISKSEAKELFKGCIYKLQLIESVEDDFVTIYKVGDFLDLCRGPHIYNTSVIKSFAVTKLAGAYWRGDSKNKMLSRIYGISFPSKELMNEYKHFLEEAARRDHREIGKKQDLFSFHSESPGCVFWHNNGMIIKNEIINYWIKEHTKNGYQQVNTPIILNRSLWEQSGHWNLYKDNMYVTKVDEQDFAIKPMSCPGSILLYKERSHSYRELPLRYAELGLVHRHELSGTLHGLCRVRQFVQDDAHIFCTENNLESEITSILQLAFKMLSQFGFNEYVVSISLRSKEKEQKYLGDESLWQKAETTLENVLHKLNVEYVSNEGDAKFYGPSVDILIKDCLGREWQCTTIQLDFNLPKRFELEYISENNNKRTPVMLHRTILGSLERFMGVLIEQVAGVFPTWLAPKQVVVIPITSNQDEYVNSVVATLEQNNIRVEVDASNESLNKRIRAAEVMRVPYIIVIGAKEVEEHTISLRCRNDKDMKTNNLEEFIKHLNEEIALKK